MASDDEKTAPKPPLLRVLGKSVSSAVNLSTLGAAAVGAAAMHSAPILALGGLAYAALVAWDVTSPAFWRKAMAREAASLPDAGDLRDPGVAEAVKQIKLGREELDRVLAETPDEVKAHLGIVIVSVSALEQNAVRLVGRAEDITRYLATTRPEGVSTEIDRLSGKIVLARDALARKEYESARAARQDQLRALEDIASARERAMANLTRMVATLEGLPPKIVRMRALDAQAMDALSGTMNEELDRINTDMLDVEETLKSLGEMANSS